MNVPDHRILYDIASDGQCGDITSVCLVEHRVLSMSK